MRDGRYISDTGDAQAGSLERTNSCFSSRTRAFNEYVDLTEAHVHAPAGGLLGSPLSGKCRPFAGALESDSPGAG